MNILNEPINIQSWATCGMVPIRIIRIGTWLWRKLRRENDVPSRRQVPWFLALNPHVILTAPSLFELSITFVFKYDRSISANTPRGYQPGPRDCSS